MSLLTLQNLTLRFGGLTAVRELSFAVERGQIFAVIGPNGAGKTSVFNAVTGVYSPTAGRILVDGRSTARPFSWKTGLGLLLSALFTATGLLLIVNIEGLWEAAITANYVYQQPFPWPKSLQDGWAYLRQADGRYGPGALAIGALIGLVGAFLIWRRARWSPDVIAASGLGRTFQNPRLFHQMTVIENVLVGMDRKLRTRFWHAILRLPLHRREGRRALAKAFDILRFVELDKEADLVASALSYGHQRRLEIARALAADPVLLLLDEPAAGMNPTETVELMELIRKIRDNGVSVLLIEHHMRVVMGVSDRIAVLEYGNKIAEGIPEDIQSDPKVRAAYLGEAGD